MSFQEEVCDGMVYCNMQTGKPELKKAHKLLNALVKWKRFSRGGWHPENQGITGRVDLSVKCCANAVSTTGDSLPTFISYPQLLFFTVLKESG